MLAFGLMLGLVGLGGGFAVVGRIKRAVVEERKWMTGAAFLEHLSVASVLPGATATNLMVMLGQGLAGARGAAAGAIGFIVPSAIMMCAAAATYDRLRGFAAVGHFLEGLGFAVVGVIAAVAIDLRKTAIRNAWQWVVAACAAATIAMRVLTLLEVVAIAAAVGTVVSGAWRGPQPPVARVVGLPVILAWAAPSTAALTILAVFAKISIATFGGGFAMIPAIAHESIAHGWLDERAFADAIALGQVTPGPTIISATFIGWRAAGAWGALAATAGMFGPPAIVAALASRSLARVRQSALVRGALLGLSPAVVGIIAAASWQLAAAGIRSWVGAAIAAAAIGVRLAWPRSSMLWPLIGGAVAQMLWWLAR